LGKGLGPLEMARTVVLNEIWQDMKARGSAGRCWGSQNREAMSSLPGSNITFCDGLVVVIIHSHKGDRYAPLVLKVYGSHPDSTLAQDIEDRLTEAGLPISPPS